MVTRGRLEDKIGALVLPLIGGAVHVSGRRIPGEVLYDAGEYGEKVHQQASELLRQIREQGILVILCTGIGEYSQEITRHIPHDFVISELGSVIRQQTGVEERDYAESLHEQINAVNRYKQVVTSHSPRVRIIEEERAASFRIAPDSEYGLSFFTIADILQQIALPGEEEVIKKISVVSEEHNNTEVTYEIPLIKGCDIRIYRPQTGENGFFVVLPENASYKNAVEHLIMNHEIQWRNVAVFGRNAFWYDLMENAGFRYTLAIYGNELKRIASGMGSYVAEQPSHHGTISVLERFVNNSLPQMAGGDI